MEKDNQPLLTLSVRSGRHVGARQTISLSAFSIGSSFESDLVLTDPSVAPSHARLSVAGRQIKVDAVAAPLFVNGAEIGLNSKAETRLPARLRIGEIEIDARPVGFGSKMRNGLPKLLIGAATLLILGGSASVVWKARGDLAWLFGSKAESLPKAQAVLSPRAEPSSLEQTRKAAASLEARLAAARISTIKLAVSAGIVSAKGSVTSAAKDSWDASQVWFDETYGRSVVLQAGVATLNPVAPEPPIAIQSVWTGKQPYLIDGQGNKHFEGVVLKEGWIVEKIEPERVTLVRNQMRMVLTF